MSASKTDGFSILMTALLVSSCSTWSTEPQVQTVKSLEEVDCSGLTRKQEQAVAQAREDHQRIKEGKLPLNAKVMYYLNDGGTVYYRGRGYDLISWRVMETRLGRDVYRIGPQTTLRPEITGGREIECESISYIPRP